MLRNEQHHKEGLCKGLPSDMCDALSTGLLNIGLTDPHPLPYSLCDAKETFSLQINTFPGIHGDFSPEQSPNLLVG